QAIDAGADEVDMVIDVAAARAGDRARLVSDVRAVAEAAHADGPAGDGGALLKVIVETALLDDDAIVLACEAAVEAGADFVKTSTGFSTAGATVEHVALMRRTVGEGIGVKASGG
ncbi:deoxyribose-phosphate aldolase, partial [Xanthomonas citri pv. citri]|nr:deoxyribose-phosphate aldolase [Xanthomonas citri pv. citri]